MKRYSILNITVTVLLSVFFIFLGVYCFKTSYLRLGESFYDLWQSAKFYFYSVFWIPNSTEITVKSFSEILTWEIFLPISFEGFEFKIFNLLSVFFIITTPIIAIRAYEDRHRDISAYTRYAFNSVIALRSEERDYTYTYEPRFLRKYYLYNFLFLSQIPFHIIALVYVQEIMQLFLTILIFFYPLVIEVFIEGILLLIKYCSKSAREERKAQAKIKEKIENEKTEELQKNFLDRY